jgi:hypothetical protein
MKMLLPAAACCFLAACASSAPRVSRGDAVDVPERFHVLELATGTHHPAVADGLCHSPLVDPRDGTQLKMASASNGKGDYEAPAGRYGLAADELLRIDCATGVAVGRVSR